MDWANQRPDQQAPLFDFLQITMPAIPCFIRVSALRGIGFTANKFAIEAFIDELARP
jgi:hypothetical protein